MFLLLVLFLFFVIKEKCIFTFQTHHVCELSASNNNERETAQIVRQQKSTTAPASTTPAATLVASEFIGYTRIPFQLVYSYNISQEQCLNWPSQFRYIDFYRNFKFNAIFVNLFYRFICNNGTKSCYRNFILVIEIKILHRK